MKFPWAAPRLLAKRAYQLPVNQLRRGECIRHKNKLWIIVSFTHHSQGRGGSHYKLELKDILSGSKGLERFNAGTQLEGVDLTERKLQFLYSADDRMHALDTESLEEFEFPLDILEGLI
jgi:elongation factor P